MPGRPRAPRLPRTGAATALRSSSRSPSPVPSPARGRARPRARARGRRSSLGEGLDRPGGSATSPKASATLPVAVACATLGRPTRATLCTDDALWTKSTVIASGSPGAESVAVSPVSSTSAAGAAGRPRAGRGARAPRFRARPAAARAGSGRSRRRARRGRPRRAWRAGGRPSWGGGRCAARARSCLAHPVRERVEGRCRSTAATGRVAGFPSGPWYGQYVSFETLLPRRQHMSLCPPRPAS